MNGLSTGGLAGRLGSALAAEDPASSVSLAASGGTWMLAAVVGGLFAAGTYLLLQRALTRVVIGLGLITHGANVLLLMAGGYGGSAPFLEAGGAQRTISDPLPQAFALTAIVIAFAVTAFLLALAYRSYAFTHDDLVQDDIEDRRIGHQHALEAEQ